MIYVIIVIFFDVIPANAGIHHWLTANAGFGFPHSRE